MCASCGHDTEWGSYWCPFCLQEVLQPQEYVLNQKSSLVSCYALGRYEKGLRHIIQDIKFNGKKGRAYGLVPFLQTIEKLYDITQIDVVVPVPISDKHFAERGYNQVDIIYKEWCKESNLPYISALVKLDHTKPMWQLNKEKRKENLEGAFLKKILCKDEKKIWESAENILLVDDVYTTGATMEMCAQVLLDRIGNKSPKKIMALALAGGAV